jgi:O-antigen/teichoic acid export membrane protein
VNFKRTLLKNIVTLGGYNYSSQIAVFLSSIVLSRLLLPEEYGFVALITVFTGFVTIFVDAGLSYAIIRGDFGPTYYRAVNNLAFLIGIMLFVIMLVLTFPIAYFYNNHELILPTIVMSTNFIFGAITIVPGAILTKQLDFNYIGKSRLISNIISILLMILFAFWGFSYWSLIIPTIILQLLQYIFFEYKIRIGFRLYKLSYSIVAYRKTKSLMTNLSSYNLVNYWARNSDNLIIGKFYSEYDLGIYNRAYKMLQLALNLISGLLGTVLYPSLKKLKMEGGNIHNEYSNVLGIISIINFPVGAILILIPDFFVRTLWGENWMLVADLLPYFGILIIFQTLISTIGHFYVLENKENALMKIGVISAIIMVACIIIGAFFSVKLIAIAYTLGFMIIIIPLYLYFGFYKTFKFSAKHVLQFWIPKLILGLSIVIAEILDLKYLINILVIVFAIHLIYFQRKDIKKLFLFSLEKARI